MALDSLGLGLTLDTSLLEKADKTLENMHKNSKLIMQNLERGFTAFNSSGADAITKLSKGLGYVSEALDKIDKAEVSPDFDTKGQEKYIGRMQHLLDMVEKLSKTRGAKFYDPTEIYVTDKTSDKISGEIAEVREHKEELSKLLDVIDDYNTLQKELQKTINQTDNELAAQNNKLKANAESYRKLREEQEKAEKTLQSQYKRFATTQLKKDSTLTEEALSSMFKKRTEDPSDSMNKYAIALSQANEKLKKEEEALGETLKKIDELEKKNIEAKKEYQKNLNIYQNRDQIKSSYDILKEEEKILKAELKFSQATQAERAAMLTKKNEAEIKADQKRIRDVQKSYEQLRKEIQKGEKDIADLEASRQTFKESNRPTKGIDNEIKRRRNELNKLMQDELEFRSSEYWPKLQAIDEKFNSEAFVKNQKALAKLAAKESRKDVTSAIQYSRNAQTINEEKEAIKRLVEARDNLSTSTARYKKTVEDINKRILAHKDHIEAVTRVEKEQNTLADSVINRYRKQLKALDEINDALEKKMKLEGKTSVADLDPNDADTQSLLARQKTIADDIAAIEKQAQGELDVIKEQHEAERAKKRIDETIKTNEREKQEYAKLLDDLYALEKQKKSMEDAGGGVGDVAYDKLLQQEADLQARKAQLESQHQNDLDEIRKKHDKRRNDDEVKAFIDAQKEKQRIAEEYAKKQREKAKKYGTISSASADRLIGVTENAKNINQHKAAIEKLTQAKSSLDNTDKNYFVTLKKIDKALRQHHKALREAGVESNNLMQSHRGLLNIGGQLARRLALAFSVSQLTQYFRKLVEVRGQFEKTEVALTSIIGDNQKAQKLMNQTIALAIKSPFTLQQLTGYTKQLAAYQVSYEELHSTTKMLADVSAGLGVEMDRLILAFGQVKAANYLRATEVRQFTEAGFNILGELAKYYGELEDRMISVGEVQEMVTKRMVDFEDVAEVFKRVTQEGGRFYEMQSKQAETLAGQWTNLQDRIDVMLNEIGTDREGLLKGLVRMLASLIDNWEAIADVLKIVVGAFVLYKMNLLAVTKSQIANNLATQESIKLKIKEALAAKSLAPIYKNLSSSMRGFSSAMKVFGKANLWVAALTAVIGSITAIVKHVQKMKEVLAEQDKIFNENTASLLKLSEQYKKASKGADAYNSKIKILQELSDKLEDRNLTLSVKIEEVDKNNIDKIFEENSERLQKAYEFGKDLGKAIAQGMNAAQGNFLGFSFFGENLKEDAEDYGKSMGKLMSWGMQAQMKNIENSARANYTQMGKYAKEYYNSIKDGKRANESEYEWTKRRATALVMISKLEGDIVGKNKELQRTLRSVVSDGLELHHETKGIYNNLVEAAEGVENLRHKVSKNPIEMAAQIKTEVDKLDYDPATKQFIINDLYAMLHLKVNYVEDPNAQSPYQWEGFKKDLKESREDLKKFKDDKGKSLGYENFFFSEDEIKKLTEFSDALEAIQKLYDENNKTIKQLDGTSDTYSKEEKARLEALQAELKEVAKKWNYDLDAKDKGGDSDALKRLKDQIKLIKDANKAYEERNKKFSKEESQAVVSDSYKDAFKEVELAIEDIDYTNLEGVVKALENLEDEAKKAGGKVELLKAISEVKAEIGLTLKESQDRELLDQVQEIFDDYELAVDIKKLNIPQDLAKNLFGVEYLDLEGLKKAVVSHREDFIGKDMLKEYDDLIKKIGDLQRKHQEEEAKEFVNFLKKNLNEIQVIQEKGAYNIALADRLFGEGKITAEQYMSSIRQIVQSTNEEVAKINLDKFKDSSLYIKAMGNLAAYTREELEAMAKALEDALANNAGDMGVDEIQAYHEALKRINKEQEKFEPFFSQNNIAKLVKYKELEDKYNTVKEDHNELLKEENRLKEEAIRLTRELENEESELAFAQETDDGSAQSKSLIESIVNNIKATKAQAKETEVALDGVQGKLADSSAEMSNISGQMGEISNGASGALMMVDMIIKEVYNTINAAIKVFEDAKELAESFGKETDKGSWREASDAFNLIGNFNEEAMAGWENLKSGNVFGAIANTIGSILGLIRDINKALDSNYEEEIENHIEEVKKLQKEYEKLEWVIDRAFSFEKYGKVAEQTQNLEKQIENTSKAIALEESKKNADEDRIKELKENAEDARRQIQEIYDSLREEIVGSYEDLGSTLADAMIEALKNGEDALKAWGDAVDDIIENIVTKLAVQKYVEPQVSRALDEFYNKTMPKNAAAEKAFNRLQNMTAGTEEYNKALAEYEKLNEQAIGELPQITEGALNDLKESLNAIGISFEPIAEQIVGLAGGQGGLSGLQKGIQGITEDKADVLAAYWNSVRGYTASIDSKMDLILANLNVGSEENPMLEQLITQTSWLSKIHGILDDLTTTSGSVSGRCVKTIM